MPTTAFFVPIPIKRLEFRQCHDLENKKKKRETHILKNWTIDEKISQIHNNSHYGKKFEFSLKLFGQLILDAFKKKHANARKVVDAWRAEVIDATWKSHQCVKNRYSTADFLHDNKIIFDLKGNQYRLVVKVDYLRQIILVEWIGTHSEYSKKRF